jgi:hypothetical protein
LAHESSVRAVFLAHTLKTDSSRTGMTTPVSAGPVPVAAMAEATKPARCGPRQPGAPAGGQPEASAAGHPAGVKPSRRGQLVAGPGLADY